MQDRLRRNTRAVGGILRIMGFSDAGLMFPELHAQRARGGWGGLGAGSQAVRRCELGRGMVQDRVGFGGSRAGPPVLQVCLEGLGDREAASYLRSGA